MARGPEGFAPKAGVVEDMLRALVSDAPDIAQVDITTLAPLIDSANASPADWHRIASGIHAAYPDYDGFLVIHGTDTMAYSAAALCFALDGLGKPVILTGAMLPLTVEGSDGMRNLRDALAAARDAPPGVWVQFAGRRLHGARVRKTHSRAFDGFNADASVVPPRLEGPTLRLHAPQPARVAVLAVAPGVPDDFFAYAARNFDGFVLRCYGSGTAPETPGLRAALKEAQAAGHPVVAVSQCPEGGMALGTYAAAGILRDGGVIDGRDMTVEAAFAKLIYTLAYSSDPGTRRARLQTALCGELTPEAAPTA